jgi:hypothetical protein
MAATVTGAERAVRLVLLAAALALIGLALPQLALALVQLPGGPVLFAMGERAPVSDRALAVLAETRETTLRVWPDAVAGRELATAAVRLGERERARAATRAHLARAPVDPAGWLRLAWLAWSDGAPTATTLELLQASIATGPYEPDMTPLRVRMALDLWPSLTPAERRALAPQVRHLWRDDPDALVALAGAPVTAIHIAEALNNRDAIAAFVERRRMRLG